MSLAIATALTLGTMSSGPTLTAELEQALDARQLEKLLSRVFVIDRRAGENLAAKVDLRKSFEKMDKDGSGFIEKGEVEVIRIGGKIQESSSNPGRGLMASADADGDGRVDFPEYERWLGGWLEKAGWKIASSGRPVTSPLD